MRLVVSVASLRALTVFGFFFCAVQLSLTTYAVIYLTDELGFGLVAAELILAVCQFAGVIGRSGWGVIADGRLGSSAHTCVAGNGDRGLLHHHGIAASFHPLRHRIGTVVCVRRHRHRLE